MRARSLTSVLVLVAAACAHEEPAKSPVARSGPQAAAGGEPAPPSTYVLADPNPRDHVIRVRLGGGSGAFGVVSEGLRVVIGAGEPLVAAEETREAILGAAPLPARLGGGFLFHTEHDLYRADTFTGALRPLGRVPESIQTFAFAPRALLVRSRNGERFAIAMPSGERALLDPVGVADVEALDDGRALAFDDQGVAYASTDGGEHWSDVTSLLRSAPTRVASVRSELWFLESGGGALRLEHDGRLSAFDTPPEEDESEIRAVDPRWRGSDTPLRTAFLHGAAVDERSALVYADGDLVRVDVHTGELLSVSPGRLPPHALCQAVPTATDVLFACQAQVPGGTSGAVSAFVAGRSLAADGPVVEQSFTGEGVFWASDDGGLAYSAPCGNASNAPAAASAPGTPSVTGVWGHTAACVRQPGGAWHDVDASALAVPPGTNAHVTRWVPRADGSALAIVAGGLLGVLDPQSGRFDALGDETRDAFEEQQARPFRHRISRLGFFGSPVVDATWTVDGRGVLRGFLRQGGSIEIGPAGRVARSPFVLETSSAGAFALGRTPEGRIFQTVDHGATWTEVAAPATGATATVHGCSSAGCDMGAFYRVGWTARPPKASAPRAKARPPADVRRTRAPELTCRAAAPSTTKVLARTDLSPDDLGLGATRLRASAGDEPTLRTVITRGMVHPVHEPLAGDGDVPGIRAVLSGLSTTRDGDVIQVLGPNRNPLALRRTLSFLAGFDPGARIHRASIAMIDVLAAGRAAGMTTDEILSDDMTESGSIVLVTPRDPAAAADVVFHNPRGLLAVARAGSERTRVAMRPSQNDALVVSAAALPNDEIALLELESGGVAHVYKLSAGGTIDLFDLGANLGDALFYPANPDAVAVGPKGEIAVLRTASGTEPPSANDPALLLVPGAKPKPLAPWSTLRLADDPACRADASGYRATLQLAAPWLRIATPDLRVDEAPMTARVKWSESRVCLEGVEVRLPSVTVRTPGPVSPASAEGASEPLRQASWLVGRGGVFGRVAVGEGIEWRQPLECALVGAAP